MSIKHGRVFSDTLLLVKCALIYMCRLDKLTKSLFPRYQKNIAINGLDNDQFSYHCFVNPDAYPKIVQLLKAHKI